MENKSSGIFVPKGNGFEELKIDSNKSIIEIAKHLGYNGDQIHSYFGGGKTDHVIKTIDFEIFTKSIIFVLTENSVQELTSTDISRFLRDFDLDEEYIGYTANSILDSGIENKSLDIDFLSRVLNIENPGPDGVFNVPFLGLNLCFSDGYLTEYMASDGLNEWAKEWKVLNNAFIESYEKEARYFWKGDVGNITREINQQAESYANIPNGMKNEFIKLHTNEYGNINFRMLMVCHYKDKISSIDFEKINFGRFKARTSTSGNKLYELGRFTYEFSDQGELLDFFNA